MSSNRISTKDITKIAIMAALVFVTTYIIKVPTLNGYTHIGDSMIFIAVLILGKNKGALASALGASLSDLLGGYMQYIIPTFIIKFVMALLIGYFAEKLMNKTNLNWIIGGFIGCLFQIVAYALVEIIFYGISGGLASIPGNIVQSITAIIIAVAFITILEKSHVLNKLKNI